MLKHFFFAPVKFKSKLSRKLFLKMPGTKKPSNFRKEGFEILVSFHFVCFFLHRLNLRSFFELSKMFRLCQSEVARGFYDTYKGQRAVSTPLRSQNERPPHKTFWVTVGFVRRCSTKVKIDHSSVKTCLRSTEKVSG